MAAFPCRPVLLALALACAPDESDSAGAVDEDGDGFIAREDCDDSNADIHPDAAEVCDDLDNDCDGEVDMEDPGIVDYSTWYVDVDGDGFGSLDQYADDCEQPENTSENADDCDDRDDDIHPDAIEVCDDIDNDCDGMVDIEDPDVVGEDEFFLDSDGDGYGSGEPVLSCEAIEGYSIDDGDCDEGDDQVHPGATETCGDGVDSDCDGEDPECEED
jgi:hypothetical protein